MAESYQIPFAEFWLEVSSDCFQKHVKEYMREANSKTWSSVILSLLFGFIAMPFIVLFASYGAAAMTYCEYFEKNLFAVLFANHARIFANQPKGLFLSWILGLGQKVLSSCVLWLDF